MVCVTYVRSLVLTTVFYLVAIEFTQTAGIVCPPTEAIAPCKCSSGWSGGIYLDCSELYLGDAKISELLDIYLTTPGLSPLTLLYLSSNNLTYIPHQLKLFPKLEQVTIDDNNYMAIEKNSLNFQVSAKTRIELDDCRSISTIAPGAFRVISDGVHKVQSYNYISLNYITIEPNNFVYESRFESTVFQSVLEEFGKVYIHYTLIDCSDCHLTWLIRDNRHLLDYVYYGQCLNGSLFNDLDPNGYADCPSFTCPLGYDGSYPDLTNCSNYYVCTNNTAELNFCSTGLVYDDQNERCDVADKFEGRCGTLFVCPNPTGSYANLKSCTSYYECTDSNPILMECPPGDVFNPAINQCDNPVNVKTNCGTVNSSAQGIKNMRSMSNDFIFLFFFVQSMRKMVEKTFI